ncbi:MAG: hypothetical protein ACQGVK_06480 [Myxococcota bacterium]
MAVQPPQCTKNALATELDVSNGEQLLYEVKLARGAQPVFAIVDQNEQPVLGSDDPPDPDGVFRAKWPPDPNAVQIPNDLAHTLGMHFVTAVEYHYRVTRIDGNGQTLDVLKDCSYVSDPHESTDRFHVALRVFTV